MRLFDSKRAIYGLNASRIAFTILLLFLLCIPTSNAQNDNQKERAYLNLKLNQIDSLIGLGDFERA